jgi:hypothetical protein
VGQPYNLETTEEVLQKFFSEEEVDPDHVAEAKGLWESSPRHHHSLASLKFMPQDLMKKRSTVYRLQGRQHRLQGVMRHWSTSKCLVF